MDGKRKKGKKSSERDGEEKKMSLKPSLAISLNDTALNLSKNGITPPISL